MDDLAGQIPEPDLNLIQSTGMGRVVMKIQTVVLADPVAGFPAAMKRAIVDDHVQLPTRIASQNVLLRRGSTPSPCFSKTVFRRSARFQGHVLACAQHGSRSEIK